MIQLLPPQNEAENGQTVQGESFDNILDIVERSNVVNSDIQSIQNNPVAITTQAAEESVKIDTSEITEIVSLDETETAKETSNIDEAIIDQVHLNSQKEKPDENDVAEQESLPLLNLYPMVQPQNLQNTNHDPVNSNELTNNFSKVDLNQTVNSGIDLKIKQEQNVDQSTVSQTIVPTSEDLADSQSNNQDNMANQSKYDFQNSLKNFENNSYENKNLNLSEVKINTDFSQYLQNNIDLKMNFNHDMPTIKINTPVFQDDWAQDISTRFASFSQLGPQSVKILLTPPELGHVVAKLDVSHAHANIEFIVPDDQVQQTLQSQITHLHQQFEQKNFSSINISVTQDNAMLQNFDSGKNASPQKQDQQLSSQNTDTLEINNSSQGSHENENIREIVGLVDAYI